MTKQEAMAKMARLKKAYMQGIINETEYAEALGKVTAQLSLAESASEMPLPDGVEMGDPL